ncbi:MAG: hypothetical protein Q4E09_02535 [Eubacteriales bacterium]|nr:hypothetical protein [Eubacteriales bacterium]
MSEILASAIVLTVSLLLIFGLTLFELKLLIAVGEDAVAFSQTNGCMLGLEEIYVVNKEDVSAGHKAFLEYVLASPAKLLETFSLAEDLLQLKQRRSEEAYPDLGLLPLPGQDNAGSEIPPLPELPQPDRPGLPAPDDLIHPGIFTPESP